MAPSITIINMMSDTTNNTPTTTVPNPIYREVKAWIAEKEAYERKHNRRAPLTNAQRSALETLRLPSRLLPAVGNTNWVGFLNEYRQATSPGGHIDYAEQEAGTPLAAGNKGHICRVELDATLLRGRGRCGGGGGLVFPSSSRAGLVQRAQKRGGDENGRIPVMMEEEQETMMTMPVFATKKMAKQYAAKCAVEFLIEHRYVPEDLHVKIQQQVARDEDDADVAAGVTTAVGSVSFPLHTRPLASHSDATADPEDGAPSPTPSSQLKRVHEHTESDGTRVQAGEDGLPPPPSKGQFTKTTTPPAPYTTVTMQYQHPIEPMSASSNNNATTTINTLPTAVPTNARELVATLCRSLGFPPPRYNITAVPLADEQDSHSGRAVIKNGGKPLFLFDGHPEFANDAHDDELIALREYARLRGVRAESQETIKNAVAGKLLSRLREIEAERRAQLETLMKGMRGGG